ncbi:MAG: hypothetical protein GF381_03350 [Candidatus Pacebacteria bacterium]|nr:hypothetical protein [Candidatus Paceibacterota bacterium]
MKNNKLPLISAALLLTIIGTGVWLYSRKVNSKITVEPQAQKKKITLPVNIIPQEEAPYLRLVPVDSHNIQIEVAQVKKPADSMEYELEYQSGSLLQGAFGEIMISELPAIEKILLGSCSAGGSCTYHEDITGGTLLLSFDGPEDYALKNGWRYFENTDRETEFGSKDAKFLVKSDDLAAKSYLIVYNSPGYPAQLPGKLRSPVYQLSTAGTLIGQGQVTIKADQDSPNLILVGYDGQEWQELESVIEDRTVTATGKLMEAYAVIEGG